jgi:SAM-dependent methyltransferase
MALMKVATRTSVARFYDLDPTLPEDLRFYRSRLPARDGSVLELGCGTGRVLVPLARHCRYAHGVDVSEEMLEMCREKLRRSGLPASRAAVEPGDIAELRLGLRFDRILAPYRVVQHLETDRQLDGLFRGIRDHLAPGGRCVLDAFRPDPVQLLEWPEDAEIFGWGVASGDERVTCHFRKNRMDADRQVLYPHLIYRRYRARDLVEEVALDMVVRYYSAGQFEDLVSSHGFRIVRRWGGYAGEEYGTGPELILEFAAR